MNRTSAVMVENHKDEEELERNRRDDEEICRNQVLGVILEKGSPCLGGRPPLPDQVLGDRGLRHLDSNLQQFSVNAGSSPTRVGEAYFPDQIPNFRRYTGSSFKRATLPIPIQSKPLALPGDDSLRLDKEQCRTPIVPQSRKPDPQDTVSATETQPTRTARTLQDQKLMPECKNLCLQSSASSETIS